MYACIVELELAQREESTIFGERWTGENTKNPKWYNNCTYSSHIQLKIALCPQLNSKQAIAICLSFIAIVDITNRPTNRLKAQWEYAGKKCIIYLQNEANRIHSRWLWATHFVATDKKVLSPHNELLQFVAEKLIDCFEREWALWIEKLFYSL